MSTNPYEEWQEICADVDAARDAVTKALFPNGTLNPSPEQTETLLEAKRQWEAALAREKAFRDRYS